MNQQFTSKKEVEKELQAALRKRGRARFGWKLFFSLSILFLCEVSLPPIPPAFALPIALLFLFLTGHSFFQAQRLPVRESLLVSVLYNGKLSTSVLCTALDITLEQAEATLREMQVRGVLRADDDSLLGEGELVYRVQGFLAESSKEIA